MSAQDCADLLRVVDRVLLEPAGIAGFVDTFPRTRRDAGCQFSVLPDKACSKPDGSAQEGADQSSATGASAVQRTSKPTEARTEDRRSHCMQRRPLEISAQGFVLQKLTFTLASSFDRGIHEPASIVHFGF